MMLYVQIAVVMVIVLLFLTYAVVGTVGVCLKFCKSFIISPVESLATVFSQRQLHVFLLKKMHIFPA